MVIYFMIVMILMDVLQPPILCTQRLELRSSKVTPCSMRRPDRSSPWGSYGRQNLLKATLGKIVSNKGRGRVCTD